MKRVEKYIQERLKEEAAKIRRLENDVFVYETVFKRDLTPQDAIGNCDKCGKMILLEFVLEDDDCNVACLECGPKKCTGCDLYHMSGIGEWKERERVKRRKKRRIVLG